MSFTPEAFRKIAHLARLAVNEQELATFTPQIVDMLEMINQLNQTDTTDVLPMSHSQDLCQRLRPDVVTEPNLREKYQAIAPEVEAGLYLVPKVLE